MHSRRRRSGALQQSSIFADFELEDNDGELTRLRHPDHLAVGGRTIHCEAKRDRRELGTARVDEIDADPIASRRRPRQLRLFESRLASAAAVAAGVVLEHRSGARAAVADDGTSPAPGDLNGYSIVEADSLEAARGLVDNHPFLSEGKGRFSVEIFELVPM